MSILKPEGSIMAGLAVGAVVFSVYSNATPPIADIRASQPNDTHIASSRKQAAIMSAGLVGAIALIAKDPTIFILGGAVIVGMDWWTRHANATSPKTGQMVGAGTAPSMNTAMPTADNGGVMYDDSNNNLALVG